MGRGQIQTNEGDGLYKVKLLFSGRADNEARIVLLNNKIDELQSKFGSMPETNPDEIWAKRIVGLQIEQLKKSVQYFTNNFPPDPVVDAYCADLTTNLTGEVGTIEIPGELTPLMNKVNIQPGYTNQAAWNQARDGQLKPSIAMGPWNVFLNKCILPGWQKFKPLYRYGTIVADSMNYAENLCDVCLDAEFSSQLNLNVNKNAGFSDCTGLILSGFADFCTRYPGHPT